MSFHGVEDTGVRDHGKRKERPPSLSLTDDAQAAPRPSVSAQRPLSYWLAWLGLKLTRLQHKSSDRSRPSLL
jgi:hypothetical protein